MSPFPRRSKRLEAEQKSLYARMADPQFYREAGKEISRARARLDELGQALDAAYARWQELESIREDGSETESSASK